MLFKLCLKGILHWNFSLRKKEVDSASYINHRYEHFITLCFHLTSMTLLDPLTRVNELEKPLIIQDLFWLKLTLWSLLITSFRWGLYIHVIKQTKKSAKLATALSHPLPWHSSTQNIFFCLKLYKPCLRICGMNICQLRD